jgi:hypothetical protein
MLLFLPLLGHCPCYLSSGLLPSFLPFPPPFLSPNLTFPLRLYRRITIEPTDPRLFFYTWQKLLGCLTPLFNVAAWFYCILDHALEEYASTLDRAFVEQILPPELMSDLTEASFGHVLLPGARPRPKSFRDAFVEARRLSGPEESILEMPSSSMELAELLYEMERYVLAKLQAAVEVAKWVEAVKRVRASEPEGIGTGNQIRGKVHKVVSQLVPASLSYQPGVLYAIGDQDAPLAGLSPYIFMPLLRTILDKIRPRVLEQALKIRRDDLELAPTLHFWRQLRQQLEHEVGRLDVHRYGLFQTSALSFSSPFSSSRSRSLISADNSPSFQQVYKEYIQWPPKFYVSSADGLFCGGGGSATDEDELASLRCLTEELSDLLYVSVYLPVRKLVASGLVSGIDVDQFDEAWAIVINGRGSCSNNANSGRTDDNAAPTATIATAATTTAATIATAATTTAATTTAATTTAATTTTTAATNDVGERAVRLLLSLSLSLSLVLSDNPRSCSIYG